MAGLELTMLPLSQNEKTFFKSFGRRLADLRKQQGLTQAELAEKLALSQQAVASFEVGRRRVPLSMLPTLGRLLGVSVEDLVGEETRASKRGPTPKLQQQLERVSRLPKARQRLVSEMIDAVLQQAGV